MKRLSVFLLILFLVTGCMTNDNPNCDQEDIAIHNKSLLSKQTIYKMKLPEGYHKDRVEIFYIDEQYSYVRLYFEDHYERYYRIDKNNNIELLYEFYLGDINDEYGMEHINITGSYMVDNKLYLCYWDTERSEFKIAYVDGEKRIDIYQSLKSIKGLYVKYICKDYVVLQELTEVTVKNDNTVGKEYLKLLDLNTNKIKTVLNLTRESNTETGKITGEELTYYYQYDDAGFFYTISNDEVGNKHCYYSIFNNNNVEITEKLYDQYFGTLDTTVAVNHYAESVPNIMIITKNDITEKHMLYNIENISLEKVFFVDDYIYMCTYSSCIIYDMLTREYLEYDNKGVIQVYNQNIYSVVESDSNEYDLKIEKIELKDRLLSDKENLTQLINDLKVYDNSYSDEDYIDKELCIHPRGEYVKDYIKIEIWSEPHINHIYYLIISDDNYNAKMYFNQNDYENILQILEEYNYERLPE